MGLPPLASWPPSSTWTSLNPAQRDTFLESWTVLLDLYLQAQVFTFAKACQDPQKFSPFLHSFYESAFVAASNKHSVPFSKEDRIRKQAFFLTHRTVSESTKPPAYLCNWQFLGVFSHAYLKSKALHDLLQALWSKASTEMISTMRDARQALTRSLEAKDSSNPLQDLKRLAPLLHSLPKAGASLAEGSELLDALDISYVNGSSALQEAMVPVAYLMLVSLTKDENANVSALLDHLYSLKDTGDQRRGQSSLIADLVTNTPLLSKLRSIPGPKGGQRAQTLATALQSLRLPAEATRRRPTKVAKSKGKGVALHDHQSERHIHLMSKITQIQDLFPDLGSGFLARLLDEYHEDVETVTSHLLEDSLPPHLASLDRALQMPGSSHGPEVTREQTLNDLIPASTPPAASERRNVFDNDEFDRLEVDSSRFHVGRKDANKTADAVLADRTRAPGKASILAALAAFDSDDDERDDTYDEADVGGTVDKAAPDGEDDKADVGADSNDQALFRAWRADPRSFDRGNEARRSAGRQKLKQDLGMTDEAIEGWALMLSRDPKRLRKLEGQYSAFDGMQGGLQRTAYRQVNEDSEDTGSDTGDRTRGGFRGRGRGRGGGRGRGRGGNVAGEASEKGTQVARQRKEASKGGRANHNRRDQRAKKMARGGFPA